MLKKIFSIIFCVLSVPCYSKNKLPVVYGTISLDADKIVFTIEQIGFSGPVYVTDYNLFFDENNGIKNVYITLYFTIRKSKKNLLIDNVKNGKKEIIIPRNDELKSENLMFFYKDDSNIIELPIVN